MQEINVTERMTRATVRRDLSDDASMAEHHQGYFSDNDKPARLTNHSDDIESASNSIGSLTKPSRCLVQRGGDKKRFGQRRTNTAPATPASLEFTIRRENQALGLFEGLVAETSLYTAKDYKRRVLGEGRYEEAPFAGRFAQVTSCFDLLAGGRWIVHWDDIPFRDTDGIQGRRFIMRHDMSGKHLPNRLPSSQLDNNDRIAIKIVNPSKTRENDIASQGLFNKELPFCIGSLSFFGFEGFDTHDEMIRNVQNLQNSILSNATFRQRESPTTSHRQPLFWKIENEDSGIVGFTLLCALSPDEKQCSYQIRLAVDEVNESVIGMDGK